MSSSDAGSSILIPLITVAAGLIGVIVGSWLTDRREREKHRRDYITRQLSELYGPLLSLRREVKARYDARERIRLAIYHRWEDLSPSMRKEGIDDKTIQDALIAEVQKFIDHGRSLHFQDMPEYRSMLAIMREHMWLAEKSTRENFDSLVEHVDTWELFIQGAIKWVPESWVEPDSNLQSFYADVEEIHDALRSELATKRGLRFAARLRNVLRRIIPIRRAAPKTNTTPAEQTPAEARTDRHCG